MQLHDLDDVGVVIHTCAMPLVVCCIYNASGSSAPSIKVLRDVIHYLCNNYCCVCLLGDFNIALLEQCLSYRISVPE
jgi:hypothetical protein